MAPDAPPFERKICHLPGTRLTAEVVLARTMTKLSRIKAVVVVIQWDDDSLDIDWSNMKVSELCMAALKLDEDARAVMTGRVTLGGNEA